MAADLAWGQIQGQRESQQDGAACLSWPNDCHLLLLGDGIGGHVGGDIASATVIDSFQEAFVGTADLDSGERLLRALQQANLALFERIEAEPHLAGMGTTLVAAFVDGNRLQWVSVGDSPLWLLRDGEMRRLNQNHSVGGVLDRRAAEGEISVREAAEAIGRSLLLEAVLGKDIERVDARAKPLRLQPRDLVLLASDGVETCSPKELCEVASAPSSSAEVVSAILEAVEARALPSQDNATVIAFRPSEGEMEVEASLP